MIAPLEPEPIRPRSETLAALPAYGAPRWSNRGIVFLNLGLSVLVLALLFWLIYAFNLDQAGPQTLPWLPTFNAACNALCAGFLVLGFLAIRSGRKGLHIASMVVATLASACFLVGYLTHHTLHGDTRFLGEGALRTVYFVLLISHILLAAVALPLVLTTLSFAVLRRYRSHRSVARWTFPIWLYVSATGVAIYVFLRYLNPPA